MHIKPYVRALKGIAIATLLAVGAAAQDQALVLKFGAYSFKKPTEVYKEFEPMLQAVQPAMKKQLGREVRIELKITKTYEECLEALVRGEVDFVRFGPASYVLAKQRQPKVTILAVEQDDGQKRCTGVIAVRADSPLKKVEDLKGKRFAFGDEQSTIGRYLSQNELVKAGIKASSLQSFQFLERHDRVFDAVEGGDFDAGALHVSVFEKRNKKNTLRVLHAFDNVGKPWIGRAGLDDAVRAALSAALIGITDEEVLSALKVTSLTTGADSDFDPVRRGMESARKFEDRGAAATPPRPGKD
jgi:phosphonate transport system substrate-binding protein